MSDKTVAITPHIFGGHSDLCLYCGCGLGWWWSSNRGKSCPARIEIEGDVLSPSYYSKPKVEQYADYLAMAGVNPKTQVVAQTGPADYWAMAGGVTVMKEPEVKVKIRPLKLETGRKFR